jgi:glyoxylase-like metal-dependent hydrolase (beta-lactamase superfamily II)
MESLPHAAGDAYTRRVEVVPGIARFRDTCNVYVLRSGRDATLIDFGSGAVLDHLDDFAVERVTDVLVTHHHRDQVQGLARAVAAGARIWVPPVERELIADVNEHWSSRPIANDYDLRQDRFSLLEEVPVTGTVDEYRSRRYGAHDVYTLPTPGHTMGSVTYLVEIDGRRVAFVGDLVYGEGKVWSLAATQWSYTGVEGQAATVVSCAVLAKRRPDVLLPSHGDPVDEPERALMLTRSRLRELLELRHGQPWDLDAWLDHPWQELSPHLLRNRTCLAHSYALLSEDGAALLIDWGYDLTTGTPPPTERAARRPLLASLDVLRSDFGVDRVDVVVTTHYHDDHVAGINLLREVEGTQVWSPENVAPVIAQPSRYDLPCLWFDPVAVDRVLQPETPVAWREYELTAYPLPGHTLHAAAIVFEVDGRRVLATGDQQAAGLQPDSPDILNYQYRNRFRIDDFVAGAELYRSLRPDLIVSGHWQPREVSAEYLDRLLEDGKRVAQLHRELLPLDQVDFGAEGVGARIEPYRATVAIGDDVELEVAVLNPFDRAERAVVRLVLPAGWAADPEAGDVELAPHGDARLTFRVTTDGRPVRRARIGADLTVGDVQFGQQAESLVNVG